MIEHLNCVKSYLLAYSPKMLLIQIHSITKSLYRSLELFVINFVEAQVALFCEDKVL